jgi:hypothetical protein
MTLDSVPLKPAQRTVIIHDDLGAPGCPTRHAGREVHNLPVGSGGAARCPPCVPLCVASHRRVAFTPPGSPIRECGRARPHT